jgi:hypothetical protein
MNRELRSTALVYVSPLSQKYRALPGHCAVDKLIDVSEGLLKEGL